MRKIEGYSLWLGHALDMDDLRAVLGQGIEAAVDLAANEPPSVITRDLVYCRFPLLDGAGNDERVLRLAVKTVAELMASQVNTLLYCSAGMSRTPAIAAAAISLAGGVPIREALSLVTSGGPADVSPLLLSDLHRLFA